MMLFLQDDDDSVGTQEYDDLDGLQRSEMGQVEDSIQERMDDSMESSPPTLNRKSKCRTIRLHTSLVVGRSRLSFY